MPESSLPGSTEHERVNDSPFPSWSRLFTPFSQADRVPAVRPMPGSAMPQPYRGLLVHSSDMTPTLEQFYHSSISLTVLNRFREEDSYYREVVLLAQQRPVEYGVIRICLGHLPQRASARVISEECPLGKILALEGIPHLSWPQDFFSLMPDREIARAMNVPKDTQLFGRRNVLLDTSRKLIAEVVEVLAPVTSTLPNQPVSNES